ncbi:amidohydrolase family protein [Halobium palmae]|uniref:Amidohydrolase family protein n=1 Tax=Halobium palmae TaxID=1776492 RepID=A0ABD5RYS0_9EURY
MGTTPTEADALPMEDLLVVDTDVHVPEHHPDIAERVAAKMEMPYSHLLDPNKGSGGYGFPRTGSHSEVPDTLSVFGGRDDVTSDVTDTDTYIDEALRERFGVDYPIINMQPMWDVYPDTEQIVQQMPAANDVLVEEFMAADDDYFGLISVQTRDPRAAAEEIDRLGDHDQLVGVFIHPGGQERGLGESRYDPIWAAAEDNGLPVVFHTTATGNMWDMAGIYRTMSKMPEIHALSHPYAMMWAVTSLVANGTPAKFPDLEFVVLESGIGWVPYLMSRLNREYSTWRSQIPLLEKMPEEYIRDQFYFSTQPLGEFNRRSHMADVIDIVGAESIVFSTDHPHFDFDNPESIRGFFSHLSEADQRAVFGENAARVFDLPV